MSSVRIGNVEIVPVLDTPVLMNPHQFMPDHAEQFLTDYADQAVNRADLLPDEHHLLPGALGRQKHPG